MSSDTYGVIGFIVGGLVFIGSWIYCIAAYGYLLGVGLGWLPSIIVGYLAGLLWPVIALILAAAVIIIIR